MDDEEKHTVDEACGGSEACAILKRMMLMHKYSEADLAHLEAM